MSSELVRARSQVLCYGSDLHGILGGGSFDAVLDWQGLSDPKKDEFPQRNPIYGNGNYPDAVSAVMSFIGIRRLSNPPIDELGNLGATFHAPGKNHDGGVVSRANLPGPPYSQRTALFFTFADGEPDWRTFYDSFPPRTQW